jgi:hypothetical protein
MLTTGDLLKYIEDPQTSTRRCKELLRLVSNNHVDRIQISMYTSDLHLVVYPDYTGDLQAHTSQSTPNMLNTSKLALSN